MMLGRLDTQGPDGPRGWSVEGMSVQPEAGGAAQDEMNTKSCFLYFFWILWKNRTDLF